MKPTNTLLTAATLAVLLSTASAFALGDNINSGNTLSNSSAVGIGGNVSGSTINNGAGSGSTTLSSSNTNTNTNNSSASSRQRQNQSQSQSNTLSNSGNSVSRSGVRNSGNSSNTNTIEAQKRNPVSSAATAFLTATDDTCMGSSSLGAQGVGLGVSVGSTWHDNDCVRRKDARELHNMGQKVAALALLCQSDSVRKAMQTADTPCPQEAEEHAASQEWHAPTAQVAGETAWPSQVQKH